jgi:flagellar biosynthesis chaperone FliJ
MIGKQYELNQCKQEYQLMMKEYNDSINQNKGEDIHLSNILFSEVCAKVKTLLAEHVFRYRTGKQYDKYVVLSVSETDKTVVVIDREDRYLAYKIPYVATQTKEGLVVNLDYENKTIMTVGVTEKTESPFSVIDEVEMIANEASAYDVEQYSNSKTEELTAKLENVTTKLEASQAKVSELENHLEVFQKEKEQYMEQKHKDIIDTLIASRRDEMGKFSEFLEYNIKIDYRKTVEQVEKELKEIHYNFMLRNNKSGGKKNFSAIEVEVTGSTNTEADAIAARYGEDIAKYFRG